MPRFTKRLPTFALLAAGEVAGCSDITQDEIVSHGGIAPDPTAIVEGSVLYVGPRPSCLYHADGSFDRVVGNVVLTLFEYENPPPPEGTATSATNLLVVSGADLFDAADCRPPAVPPNDDAPVTRGTRFSWPSIALEAEVAKDYQVRGFYDYNEDMVPFFSVTRLPTRGDIVGAALNDIEDTSKGFLRVSLPRLADAPNGVVRRGVNVALGNTAWTDRPAFKLDENRQLAADARFDLSLNVMGTDGPNMLRTFRALTCKSRPATGSVDGTTCGLTLQRLEPSDKSVLDANRVDLDLTSDSSYAFYAQPVDIETVIRGGADLPVKDGLPDPHPLLGHALDIDWYTPIAILERFNPDPLQEEIETDAHIPRVLMMGSVLLDNAGLPTKTSYVNGAPMVIPPAAVVELIEGRDDCRVPYFAPGTSALVTAGRVAHCSELPTGHFTFNVFSGIAGGERVPAASYPLGSESPMAVTDGTFSGQSWSVPNELGDPREARGGITLAHQGVAGSFVVHDPTPDASRICSPTMATGLCDGPLQRVEDNRREGIDAYACLPRACCEAIAHLCGVPRCAMVTTDRGAVSAGPTRIVGTGENDLPVPDCIPFDLPVQCPCPPI